MVGLGGYLDVIGSDSHDVFLVLRIFGEKSQKGAKRKKNWAKMGQWAVFGFLFPNTSYSYPDSLRTLIND